MWVVIFSARLQDWCQSFYTSLCHLLHLSVLLFVLSFLPLDFLSCMQPCSSYQGYSIHSVLFLRLEITHKLSANGIKKIAHNEVKRLVSESRPRLRLRWEHGSELSHVDTGEIRLSLEQLQALPIPAVQYSGHVRRYEEYSDEYHFTLHGRNESWPH